jgi:lipopolysaccharide export system permease protein
MPMPGKGQTQNSFRSRTDKPTAVLKTIDKYVLKEMIPQFIVGLLAFGVIFISVTLLKQVMEYFVEYKISFDTLVLYFLLGLPQVIAFTIPMAMLLATLLTIGQLSSRGEITAFRAGGYSFARVMGTLLVFSFLIVCLNFILNEKLAPEANRLGSDLLSRAARKVGRTISSRDVFYSKKKEGWFIYAERQEGPVLYGVRAMLWDDSRGTQTVYEAERAQWNAGLDPREAEALGVANDGSWVFLRGTYITYNFSSDPGSEKARLSTFKRLAIRDIQIKPEKLSMAQRKLEELSFSELATVIEEMRWDENIKDERVRELQTKLYMKVTVPFSSLIFVLIGGAMALTGPRATSSTALGWGLSLIFVLAYYVVMTVSIRLGSGMALHPLLFALLPNIVFLLIGVRLNWRFWFRQGY